MGKLGPLYPDYMTGIPISQSHPEIAAEADGWEPSNFSAGSDFEQNWICTVGHKWRARISDRTSGSGRCPTCIGKKVLKGFNDLATLNPLAASQAFGWDPTTITVSSNKSLDWKCSKGHIWTTKPSSRRSSRSDDCPVCIGKKVLSGFNDLQTTHPELAKEANGWDPAIIKAGSKKNLMWICSNKHEWTARVSSRALQGAGCRKCGTKSKVPKTQNSRSRNLLPSIYSLNSQLASEALGWDPKLVSAGNNSKKTWKCSKGHIWEAVVNSRVKGRGCPVCAGKKVEKGFNDLAKLIPQIAGEANGWDPSTVTVNSNKILSWICGEGHIWTAKVASRASGKGCPVCAGNIVLEGFNDLQTTHPDIALEAVGWDPKTLTSGAEKKVRWRCSENHLYTSNVKDRTQGHGCPACSRTGFDQTKDGWFYLLSHPNWGLLQLGITNVPVKRISKHKKLGWEVIEIEGPMNGLSTRDLETKCLQYLRKNNLQVGVQNIAGKFDGFSESWFEEKLPIKSIRQLRNLVDDE